MIAIVIYGIIAIALAAVAGFSIMSFFDASRTMSNASENMSRMNMALNLLKANVRFVDGAALVPMGSASVDYTILPTWVGAHDTSTSGDKYIYCPFASENNATLSTGIITDGDSIGTYPVFLKKNTQTGDRDYVYGFDDTYLDSSVQNIGALAFLLSPIESVATLPLCSNVKLNASNNFVVDNGIVKVLQLGTIADQRNLSASSKAIFYVEPLGTGDGRDAANAASIDEALSFMAFHAPRVMEIKLAPGNYSVTEESFIDTAKSQGESKIILIGDTGDSSNIFISSTIGSFNLPSNLYLKNVGITSDLIIRSGNSVFVEGIVKLDSLSLQGGDLLFYRENVDLEITGQNPDLAGITVSSGSRIISIADNVGVKNDLIISGNPTHGIYSKGEIDMAYTDMIFASSIPRGITIDFGAILNLNYFNMANSGATPSTGVYDNGGAYNISGEHSIIKATVGNCWNTSAYSLFEYSNVGTGASSLPLPNTVNWSLALVDSEVSDYVESRAIQYSNRSNWECQ